MAKPVTPSGKTAYVRCLYGEWRDLVAGLIDNDAEFAYTHGQCLALARALHERRPDWPIVALADAACLTPHAAGEEVASYDGLCLCQVAHIGVLSSDGRFVDIHGSRILRDALEASLTKTVVPCSSALLAGIRGDRSHWQPQRICVARSFVDTILERLDAGPV
jgi:hypothetical protein